MKTKDQIIAWVSEHGFVLLPYLIPFSLEILYLNVLVYYTT